MKLFIVAALIAVASAARLEHLERGYLPPDQGFGSRGNSGSGNFGQSGQNSLGQSGSFGQSGSGSFSQPGQSHGFGSNDQSGQNSFGSPSFQSGANSNAGSLKQYLPPNRGPSGSSFRSSGSFGQSGAPSRLQSIAQQYGAPQQSPSQQYGAPQQSPSQQYGAPSQQSGAPSQQYNAPSQQYGAPGQSGQSAFRSQSGSFGQSAFGGQSGKFDQSGSGSSNFGRYNQGSQSQFGQGAASRQYLAPKTQSSFDNIPQQAFDEQTGYHY